MVEGTATSQLEQGLGLHRQGRLDEAAALYEMVLAADPRNADALHFLGLIAHQKGENEVAVDRIDQAIILDEARPTFHYNLGTALAALTRLDEAVDAFRRSAALDPSRDDTLYSLGTILGGISKFREAETALRQAVTLNAGNAVAWSGLSAALGGLRQYDEAEAAGRKALAIDPRLPEAHLNLGNALHSLGEMGDAEAAFRTAIDLNLDYAIAYNSLGKLLADVMALEEALDCFRRALEIDPTYRDAASNYLLYLLYDCTQSEESLYEAHLNNARTLWPYDKTRGGEGAFPDHDFDLVRRLRVGYVSADFRTHSCAYFLAPLFDGHDRTAVELFAYSNVIAPDGRTKSFQSSADCWRDISQLDDTAAAALIRNDRIDILVELSGHTRGNRLGVFARRPAPLQVSWLGYPATAGMVQIDCRLTDDHADPIGPADEFHCEELIRLPDGFHCYAPAPDAPEVSEPPVARTGQITFGSFNNFLKLSPACLDAWADILQAVPSSRLLLKSGALNFEKPRGRLHARFADRGIDPGRVQLHGWIPRDEQPLSLYGEVDIGLDTFPYNGTTTSFEALWMGVPLLTLVGERHAARVGSSILTHLGYGELVAHSVPDYVDRAVMLANDQARIAEYRRKLRPDLAKSAFCDGNRFASAVEKAYRDVWMEMCRKNT